jgi:4-hydroxymandelate oxidase
MQLITLGDYETLAASSLNPKYWDYFQGGSDDEVTLRANREAYQRLRLRPRVLVDVSQCHYDTTVLGTPVSMPILVAPMAYHCLVHPEGECETARGVGSAQTIMTVSSFSTRSVEDVAQAATGPLWFQLYLYKERSISEELIRRVEAAGYQALVFTVDAPRLGNRERDRRNSFALPPGLNRANFLQEANQADLEAHEQGLGVAGNAKHAQAVFDPALTWDIIAWLRSITSLPILVKGVLRADDAQRAVDHGVDGIIVSNHGGRQLDSSIATLDALPEVVAAVNGRCEVYMDGGIRRGTDVLKALALGARAVLVGRPIIWGLATQGAEGVQNVLHILQQELELAMMLAGYPTLQSIDSTLLQ